MSRYLETRSERLSPGDRIHAGALVSYADHPLHDDELRRTLTRTATIIGIAVSGNNVAVRTNLFSAHIPTGVLVGRLPG